MADSFFVETRDLRKIRTLLVDPQAWLDGHRTGTTGTAAAAAAGPARNAVAAFGASLDRFLAAGAIALASDIRAIDANGAAYERTDLDAARLFGAGR